MNNTKEYILKPYSDIYSPILSVTIVGIFLYYLTYNLYILLVSTFVILLFYSFLKRKSKIKLNIKESEIIIHYTNFFGFKSLKKYSLHETNYSFKLENITSISSVCLKLSSIKYSKQTLEMELGVVYKLLKH